MRHDALPANATVISGLPLKIGNEQHIGQRDSQQDAYGFSHLGDTEFAGHAGYVAVLADGMGGLENGSWASTQGVSAFLDAYRMKTRGESIDAALLRAAGAANACVHQEARRLGLEERMGTTLVAAAVRDRMLYWISIGDSRVYLCEAGQLLRLSTDHNFSEVLNARVRRGEITLAEAQTHPLRNGLTSYLGRAGLGAVDQPTASLALRPGTWIVLCSDGLSGVLSEAEIVRELHGTAQAAASRLIASVLRHGEPHQDNVTVVVLQVPQAGNAIVAGDSLARGHLGHRPEQATRVSQAVPAWIGAASLTLASLIGALIWWQRPAPAALPVSHAGMIALPLGSAVPAAQPAVQPLALEPIFVPEHLEPIAIPAKPAPPKTNPRPRPSLGKNAAALASGKKPAAAAPAKSGRHGMADQSAAHADAKASDALAAPADETPAPADASKKSAPANAAHAVPVN